MNFRQRLAYLISGRKDSEARIGLSYRQVGQAVYSPTTYEGFSREGYAKNVMVYRCIYMIAKAISGIQIELYQKRVAGGKEMEIETHPLLDLMRQPNPLESGKDLTDAVISYFLLTGNFLLEQTKLGGNQKYSEKPPLELWAVSPGKIKIKVGAKGYPARYELCTPDLIKYWDFDPIKLKSNLIHMKSFNPNDLWWGQSPLQAAMLALDQSNAADKWNLSLLQNSATPSGVMKVLVSDSNPTGSLSEKQFQNLKEELEYNYSGPRNAGRPMLLEGGLDWTQISLSPKEMSFLENKKVTSADIATVFGVPLELVGLGQKTFNNYAEARCAFYEETVLPLYDSLLNKYNNCITPSFGQGLRLGYDPDDIEALEYKRAAKFTSIASVNFLTQNEKRKHVGYEEIPGWDVFVIGSQILESPDDMVDESVPAAPTDDVEEVEIEEVVEEDQKGFKAINLLNRNEKLKSWKRQNAMRDRLATPFERDLKEDFSELTREIEKSLKGTTERSLLDYQTNIAVDKAMKQIERTLSKHIRFTIEDFSQEIFSSAKSVGLCILEKKASRNFQDWVDRYVKTKTGSQITLIEGTTRKKVREITKEWVGAAIEGGESNSDLARELMLQFGTISKSRAHTIARTEVANASNDANLNAARDLEVPGLMKEWVSNHDSRVRDGGKNGQGPDHEAMDGVQIPLEDSFAVPPDATMDGPGDSAGGAEQVINCRCVLVFSAR